MLPFDLYPGGGRQRLGVMGYGNCRTSYGAQFLKITKQVACAYCGMDLWDNYDRWKFMTLDHVVPQAMCDDLNIPTNLCHDYSNAVLSCLVCNSFDNQFWHSYKQNIIGCAFDIPETFWNLRDQVFPLRKERIAKRALQDQRDYLALNPLGRLSITAADLLTGPQ